MVTEDRMEQLEVRLALVERRLGQVEPPRFAPPRAPFAAVSAPPARSAPRPRSAAMPRSAVHVLRERAAGRTAPDLEQLLGGRVLAWVGSVAVLVGLAFLLALGIAGGWIGEGARTLIAGAASCALLGAGVVLHERHGRTEAARAAVGVGLAGLFLTLAVATRVYDLLPAALALPAALVIGALATTLAVRWHAGVVAAIGIVGAVLSPALTDAPLDGGAMPFLLLAVASGTAVVIWRRWNWLSLAAFAAAAPQVGLFLVRGETAPAVVVLAVFGVLNAVAALGYEVRVPAPRVRAASAFLLMLSAVVVAPAGYLVLEAGSTKLAAIVWLGAVAVAHLAAAGAIARRAPQARDARDLCLVLSVLLADAAIALAAHGPARALAWAAGAVLFAALGRRLRGRGADGSAREHGLAGLGLGGHIGLALVQALAQLDLGSLGPAGGDGGAVAALAALAAGCLVSARLADGGREELRVGLDATGLVAVAMIALLTLGGPALTAAWALEAVALAAIARRGGDRVAAVAAGVHLGAAALYALADQASPAHLVDGAVALGPAALGTGAVAAAALLIARGLEPAGLRRALHAAAGVTVLYLASLAAVGLAPDAAGPAALHFGAAQQGQLQLSTLWALTGVAGLLLGLRRDSAPLRLAALGLLGLTTAKVFLFDLATLSAGYRVGSFIAVGVLLLLASFAYARLRPEPLADLRAVPDGLR